MAQSVIEQTMKRSPEAEAAIRELAVRELERRKKENPLKYFIPNGAQERLINAVGESEKSKKWIFCVPAANSVGKSAVVINIIGNVMWGSQSEWFRGPLYNEKWQYPKKIWYMSTHTAFKTHICGSDELERGETEIKKFFPEGRYDFYKNGLDYYSQLYTDSGWEVTFKTYDQDPKQYESTKIGIAVFDEPPPKSIYNAVLARLTSGGIIIMPMTPLTFSAWVKDEIVDNAKPDTFVLFADVEENCRIHGVRGLLDHDRIVAIVDRYDEDEREARAHGTFAHLSGLVYRDLHPDINRCMGDNDDLKKPSDYTQDKYRIYCIADPHDAKPPFVIWAAIDAFGRIDVVDEYPNFIDGPYAGVKFSDIKRDKLTTSATLAHMKFRETTNGWDARKIVRGMDPLFGRQHLHTQGMTVQRFWSKCGREMLYSFNFSVNINNEIEAGHKQVQELITPNKDNETRLRIGRNCVNTWHSLTHYARKQPSNKQLENDGGTDTVQKKFKDPADSLRYLVMMVRKPMPAKPKKKPITNVDQLVHSLILPKIWKRSGVHPSYRSNVRATSI